MHGPNSDTTARQTEIRYQARKIYAKDKQQMLNAQLHPLPENIAEETRKTYTKLVRTQKISHLRRSETKQRLLGL